MTSGNFLLSINEMANFSIWFIACILVGFVSNDSHSRSFGKVTAPVDTGFRQSSYFNAWQIVNKTNNMTQPMQETSIFTTNTTNQVRSVYYVLKDSSVTISFSYAIYRKNSHSKTKLILQQEYDNGTVNKIFESHETNGKMQTKLICCPHAQIPYRFAFYAEVTENDQIDFGEIEMLKVHGCFQTSSTVECSFDDLCDWTIETKGTEWKIAGKNDPTVTKPVNDHNDNFLSLTYNSSNSQQQIQLSEITTTAMSNHSSYLQISFAYFILSSTTSTPGLKLKITHQNTHWIFDSRKMRTDTQNWKNETICTNVDTKNIYTGTQVIFQGEVQEGTAIGLDNVTVGECLNRLSLKCSFDNDVCGWSMASTSYDAAWEIIRESPHISPRNQNNPFLRISPSNETKQFARLSSPLLLASNFLHFIMWYFVNDNQKENSTLKIGLSSSSAPFSLLWSYERRENVNAQWREINLNITDIREDSKILINAMVHPGSYLAIDDIDILYEGNRINDKPTKRIEDDDTTSKNILYTSIAADDQTATKLINKSITETRYRKVSGNGEKTFHILQKDCLIQLITAFFILCNLK